MKKRHNAPSMIPIRLRGTVVSILCVSAFLYFSHVYRDYRSGSAADFYQFWVAGKAARSPEFINIYAEQSRKEIGEKYYQEALKTGSRHHVNVANMRRDHFE